MFVNVAASVLSAAMVIDLLGAENKMINLFIMVPILLVFGEITPKTLAIRNNRAFAVFQSKPIDFFARMIAPLRWVIRHVADWFITLIVGRERSRGNIITADLVRTLAYEAVGEGTLDDTEARFIDQIFEFGNLALNDVMTSRADIHFIPVETPLSEVLKTMRVAKHSRFPVYQEHRDTIIGILHSRDLLGVDLERLEADPEGLRGLLREPSFFSESKPAVELFDTFRQRKQSFALVVDEFGGVTGLVTMEDLLECVFGEIRSPSDVPHSELIEELGDGRYSLDAALSVIDFNQVFSTRLDGEQAETVGGVLLNAFGELPQDGAGIELLGFRFTVTEVEANRITRVLMEKPSGLADIAPTPTPTPALGEGGE